MILMESFNIWYLVIFIVAIILATIITCIKTFGRDNRKEIFRPYLAGCKPVRLMPNLLSKHMRHSSNASGFYADEVCLIDGRAVDF